jgi:peptidoglycan/LPS O-acetylase OafA/YrhL
VAVAPKRLFHVAAVVTAIVAALVATGQAAQFKGFFFDGLWLQFAAGILVHAAINHGRKVWALGILAAALAWQWFEPGMATAFGFAILLILMHPVDRPFADGRWARPITGPITWCGTMCYSLYLVHWPLCKAISHATWLAGLQSETATMLVTVPLCLAASIGAGYTFHVLVERRFLNAPLPNEARPNEPRPAPAVSGLASPTPEATAGVAAESA